MAEVDYCILSEFYKWILNHEDTNIDLIGKLMIWGTTTRILIIFGVPPHKYKYLKMTPT
jgi:hypothetical protein